MISNNFGYTSMYFMKVAFKARFERSHRWREHPEARTNALLCRKKILSFLACCFVGLQASICQVENPQSELYSRLDEAHDLAVWLIDQSPTPNLAEFTLPIFVGGALPLTTTATTTEFSAGLSSTSSVHCFDGYCDGKRSGSMLDDSGIDTFIWHAQRLTSGTVVTATAEFLLANNAQLRWNYEQGNLQGKFSNFIGGSVTEVIIDAAHTITADTEYMHPTTTIGVHETGSVVWHCTVAQCIRIFPLVTHERWQYPERTHWLAKGLMVVHYPDATTSWTARSDRFDQVISGSSFFGSTITAQIHETSLTSRHTFPSGEAVRELLDQVTLDSTDPAIVHRRREIRTSDQLLRNIFSTQTTSSTQLGERRSLSVRVEMDYFGAARSKGVFDARGAFEMRENRMMNTVEWQGALQTLDGSLLTLNLTRDVSGRWRASASYDDNNNEIVPDEEYEFWLYPDGSAHGTGHFISAVIETNDPLFVGSDSQTRVQIDIDKPPYGARYSAR